MSDLSSKYLSLFAPCKTLILKSAKLSHFLISCGHTAYAGLSGATINAFFTAPAALRILNACNVMLVLPNPGSSHS